MSASSFRSVFMVASCAGAALGCYLVSLRVASERAALEEVETRIVLAQRDIRVLQTEIGTRGRLAQLERWNVKVIALSAPTADQFLKGGFELARLTAPEREAPIDAPVILASAPAPTGATDTSAEVSEVKPSRSPAAMMHLASLKTAPLRKEEVSLEPRKPATAPPKQKAEDKVSAEKSRTAEKTKPDPSKATSAAKGGKASAEAKDALQKTPRAAAAKKPAASAARDPLAPLPEVRTKIAAAKPKTSKDSAKAR